MTTSLHPMPQRALMPDMVRAVALFGIAIVNVMGFSWAFETGFFGGAIQTPLDEWMHTALWSFFAMKFYALFSMMFGAGLAYQMHSAAIAQRDFTKRYLRRLAMLFAMGILHFIFFWMGDILMAYALSGALFLAMKDMKIKNLIQLGFSLILLNAILLLIFGALLLLIELSGIDLSELMDDASNPLASEVAALGSSNANFMSSARFRALALPTVLPSVLMQQGMAIVGFFCFGLAAVRSGAIDDPHHRIWRRARLQMLPAGLMFSLIGGWLMNASETVMSSSAMFGMAILMAASPLLAVGYVGLIAKASTGTPGPFRRFIARAGSASLTAYLLQSLILSFIFCGYGLGLHSQLSASQAMSVGAVVAILSLIATGAWRSFFARGPMEVLLRKVTYFGEN